MGTLQLCDTVVLTGEGQDVSGDVLGTVLAALSAAWQHAGSKAVKAARSALILTHLPCTQAALSHLPRALVHLKLE
jgi:hypothetical protein